jgi:hypothetical protein
MRSSQFEYADLKLGMRQGEVNYVKGQPTDVIDVRASDSLGGHPMIEVSKLDQGRTAEDLAEWSPSGSNGGNFKAKRAPETHEVLCALDAMQPQLSRGRRASRGPTKRNWK